MKLLLKVSMAMALVALVSGCSSLQHRTQMSNFNLAYAQGDYEVALKSMDFEIDTQEEVDTESHLLEILHQAELYRLNGQFDLAVEYYDLAEDGMKYLDTAHLTEKAGETLMAIMLNDSARDFEALMSEAILVNTYKALAFLAAGNNENARIEFNRANDRTRRAVEFFEKEIADQQERLEEEAAVANAEADDAADESTNSAAFVQQSLGSEALHSSVAENYGAPSSWSVFPEFMVPTSIYLNGIYLLANGADSSDYGEAATLLKRVADMNSNSRVLARDAKLAERMAAGTLADLGPQVWVVYENGLGPVLEEARFDVPLYLYHGNQEAPAYTGIALPRYKERTAVPGAMLALTAESESQESEHIADMGTVIRTEMKARFTGVLTRAVTSAVIKAVIQNEASERFGVWGQLGSAVLTAATTQADLRGWQAMPDHWQAMRLERPDDGQLTLAQSNGDTLGTLDLPDQPFTLVYVKRPTQEGPATVMTIDLQGATPAIFARLPDLPETAQISSNQ